MRGGENRDRDPGMMMIVALFFLFSFLFSLPFLRFRVGWLVILLPYRALSAPFFLSFQF